mmetsp:Transcript_108924/g.150654  ORF Transcript_108924/g.150654 Transcript_108924/m.150654 type:complete len:80 (-) Transcript_108924:81-320(-)
MHASVSSDGAKLGASHTSAQYQSSFTEDLVYLYTETASCIVYQASLDEYDPPELFQGFINGVNTLPDEYNYALYMNFIN